MAQLAGTRRRLRQRRASVSGVLAIGVIALFAASLMVGDEVHGPATILRVLAGEDVPGAAFVVGELRLPRATLGVLAGVCFGAAGVTFQILLRNPLASPDVIGVNIGASAAAVIGIVLFSLGDTEVSLLALAGAILVATILQLLGRRHGGSHTRLILVGIGLDAMLRSVVTYVLSRASEWDLQTAMRWLTGSLNGATWARIVPLGIATVVGTAVLILRRHDLEALRLGTDTAAALGVRVARARSLLMAAAVVLLAFATAAAGPISFVAFMAGPIAARVAGPGASLVVPAGLVGAVLVVGADLIGQQAFETRFPVGVVTGALGAPYLVLLLIRANRSGGSL